ncbi:MAG: hypothetical protein KDF60_10985 [Calditrichaeota bacterium]|nr:hypothetical protein [Calditrichota bacterium]
MKYLIVFITSIAFLLFVQACTKEQPEQPDEKILARIGDKTISVNEFIRRAEYTVRPPYCNSSMTSHKMIVLNSLIAEKLLSMEATDSSTFITHPKVQAFLTGIKEQAMRQWLYNEKATKKVKLDSAKVYKTMQWADRTYKIAYLSLPESGLADDVYKELSTNPDQFDTILLDEYGLDQIPQREVKWHESENDAILEALFNGPLKKGEVLKPVTVNNSQYVVIKILGWNRQPAITQTSQQDLFTRIADRYKSKNAMQYYEEYVSGVMKGKQLDFNRDTFYKLAEILKPVYLKSSKEKEAEINEVYWGVERQAKNKDSKERLEQIRQQSILTVDGEMWTVDDLMKKIDSHPLVFRKRKMKNEEFEQQFQWAIADLIRDKYLTEEAYDSGYDKVNVVQRNVGMWKDSFNAQNYRDQYLVQNNLDSLFAKNYIKIIDKNLKPYIDSLQVKYSDKIEINTEEFNKINLTKIDLFVTYNNEAYPMVVPSFPQLTTDQRLDYGRKMQH